jgi:hypothetical protein
VAETSGTRAHCFFIQFLIFTLALSLTSAGILNGNMAMNIDAYATKSDGSSGGGSSNDGSSTRDRDSSDEGGGSNDGSDNGGSGSSSDTGGDNNPTIEEPNPTLIAPPPPPPPTCEQGSTSPECSNVPEPPGPPVDCKTTPDDPSCTTPSPVDCKANPNDASCGPQPVDCTTTPDDPSCKPDCTKNPDDQSCKVDCTANPNDPSCPPTPPCQSAVIGISCPPVDCTKNPDDQSCPPIHIDCPERVGFTLRAIENGKCVYDPIKCKQDEQLVNNKCSPSGPDESCLFHPEQDKCKPDHNGNCPNGFLLNDDNHCVPDKPCPKGFEHHAEDESGACYPIKKPPCQADGSLSDINGKCTTSNSTSSNVSKTLHKHKT